MDNLAKCPTAKKMREELENLPENLTKTYERMLQSIPKNLRNSATRLLQFLVHSEQPLTLQEAKEVIATNIDVNPPFFDADDRVFEESLVLQYAPGLISIVEVRIQRGRIKKELHLAHFSVKEFLETQADFGLPRASNTITRTCLTYLKDITGSHNGINQDFPMARFAAKIWTRFGSLAEAFRDSFQAMLVFVEGEETFQR
jgi:flagellar basal body rod protein FlgB